MANSLSAVPQTENLEQCPAKILQNLFSFKLKFSFRLVGDSTCDVERLGQRPLLHGRRVQQPVQRRGRLQVVDAKFSEALQHKQVTLYHNRFPIYLVYFYL